MNAHKLYDEAEGLRDSFHDQERLPRNSGVFPGRRRETEAREPRLVVVPPPKSSAPPRLAPIALPTEASLRDLAVAFGIGMAFLFMTLVGAFAYYR